MIEKSGRPPGPRTVQELRTALTAANIDPQAIRLDGFKPEDDNVFCLTHQDGRWHVFFRERGIAFQQRSFEHEADACAHFLETTDKPYLRSRGAPFR